MYINFKSRLSYFVLFYSLIYILLLYFLIDISQWREDQATNYWIAYVYDIKNISTGLVSSKYISNPNGMILIGKLISFIPNFKLSILFYSYIQFLMIAYFIKTLNLKVKYTDSLLIVCFSVSYFFVLNSIELWSQYFSISLNLLIFGILFKYLNTNNKISFLILINSMLFLASFYLAGFMSAVSYFLVVIYLLKSKNLIITFKFNYLNFFILVILLWTVWIPYLNQIDLKDFLLSTDGSNNNTNIFNILYIIFFNFIKEPFSLFTDFEIFSVNTLRMRTILILSYKTLNIIFGVIITFLVLNKLFIKKFNLIISSKTVSIFIFLLSYYCASPLIGGPNFFIEERLDMQVQFYLLFISMLIIFFDNNLGDKNTLKYFYFSNLSLIIYIILNISYTLSIYNIYINYNGSIISNSDVPLKYKLEAVDYIYSHAKNNNNVIEDRISVYYDLEGENFRWINEFGTFYPENYNSPYTIGRVFDLIFLKHYGISNFQEGKQFRSVDNQDYIITYKNLTNYNSEKINIIEIKDFNRLRIIITDNS